LDSLNPSDLEGDFLGKLGLDLARPPARLGKLAADGAAQHSGLKEGDVILRVDGTPVRDGVAFIELVRSAAGRRLELDVLRGETPVHVSIVPAKHVAGGSTIGRIGAEISVVPDMVTASEPPLRALRKGIDKTWESSALTLKMLGKMIVGEVSWKNITGPITIADYAGQTARVGMISYLTFIAFISISLGVMNLLPIPVLDGGLLLYYSLEVLTGRALPERVGEIAQRAGVGILMTLMAVAVFNDIMRLMS
ncbi:RIP metalloprotease RseP, partial [Oxalobacteraceae bacterium OM1]